MNHSVPDIVRRSVSADSSTRSDGPRRALETPRQNGRRPGGHRDLTRTEGQPWTLRSDRGSLAQVGACLRVAVQASAEQAHPVRTWRGYLGYECTSGPATDAASFADST